MTENEICIEQLNLSFNTRNNQSELNVLRSISLEVIKGEFIAVLGPSGCGKTSLLKVIGGLLENSDHNVNISGQITIQGLSPNDAKRKRLFGFAFQNPVLLR